MTIIVGYKAANHVILGADSQGSSGWNKTLRKDPKVFVTHGIGYAFTSSYRMGQILRFHSEEKDLSQVVDPYSFVVSELVPMWRKILKENGYTKIDNNQEQSGVFLVALKNKLFKIESDFQVGESEALYEADGCGFAYALGALYTLENSNISIEDKVTKAIEAAINFSNGCGGRIDLVRV